MLLTNKINHALTCIVEDTEVVQERGISGIAQWLELNASAPTFVPLSNGLAPSPLTDPPYALQKISTPTSNNVEAAFLENSAPPDRAKEDTPSEQPSEQSRQGQCGKGGNRSRLKVPSSAPPCRPTVFRLRLFLRQSTQQ